MGFFCFAVFYGSRQLRVFPFSMQDKGDMQRAKALALDMQAKGAAAGYSYTVEFFNGSGVGVTVKN